MLNKRVIPFLLLYEGSLIKTKQYKFSQYIGDPINTVRIFNELEVDEIALINVENKDQSLNKNLEIIKNFASECFMPACYGGGIRNLNDAETIFKLGYEKIIINSSAYTNKTFINDLKNNFGAQAIIVSIDIKKNKVPQAFYNYGKEIIDLPLLDWIKKVQDLGAGELIINDIDNEGTWNGLDQKLFVTLKKSIHVPYIIHGGANSIDDLENNFKIGFGAIGIGNLAVFQKKDFGVLINYPKKIFL
jgi:imidazole glycerol-phosphate synthase subunit HisF